MGMLLLAVTVCMFVTGMVSIFLFNWVNESVEKMKKQLEEATEENLKSEKIRSEFVANVSHELKTPLTSILGFIETLQDGAADNPELRTKFLDIVAIETSRLKRLIEDLLVLSDIESKRDRSEDKQISIEKSVQEIVSSIYPIAEAREVNVNVDIDQGITILGNEDRFKQMMLNLIENAIKYSKIKGTVYIFSEILDEGKSISITVKDEGIGISKEHIERLFERFYRVDKSRSTKVGGTGLGLSIVKHIASLFEAELKVESEINKGSSFKVIFSSK
jgi:two-component system phosphate regulon sensor histidine kinase PhoR